MAQEPRWLTSDEQDVWRSFARLLALLPAALDAQLSRDADLVQYSYWVLVMLSEAPERALRMSELAANSSSSPSRLSHIVRRLEQRGLVLRRPATDDGRGAVAVLTDTGYALLVQVAPSHVTMVHELVFETLTATQMRQLGAISRALLAAVDKRGSAPGAAATSPALPQQIGTMQSR